MYGQVEILVDLIGNRSIDKSTLKNLRVHTLRMPYYQVLAVCCPQPKIDVKTADIKARFEHF